MSSRLLKLAWAAVAVGCLALAVALYVALPVRLPVVSAFLALSLLLTVTGFAFLTVRVSRFRASLVRLVRQFLRGNYEARMPPSKRINDEITALENLVNRLAEHLRAYDVLRAERVATSTHALNLLLWQVSCPIIAADVQKTSMRLNPAARKVFSVEQETYSFEAMENQPENAPLMQAIEQVCGERKVPADLDGSIRFPGRDQARQLKAKLVPVKGRDEAVNIVFMLIS